VVILDLHYFALLPPESPSSLKNGLGGRLAIIYLLNACTWAGKDVGTIEERFKFVEVKLVNVTILSLLARGTQGRKRLRIASRCTGKRWRGLRKR
jgi:hypothetical protein